VCDLKCSGSGLVGVWVNTDPTTPKPAKDLNWFQTSLNITSDKYFELIVTVSSASATQPEALLSWTGTLSVDFTQKGDIYQIDFNVHVEQHEAYFLTIPSSSLWNYICNNNLPSKAGFQSVVTCLLGPSQPAMAWVPSQCASPSYLNLVSETLFFSDPIINDIGCPVELRNVWDCNQNNLIVGCVPRCGDSIIISPEECDDGNNLRNDGCFNCKLESGWSCEQTFGNLSASCEPICGDQQLKGDEECDDGNEKNGDGCSQTCQVEAGWTCDSGGYCYRPNSKKVTYSIIIGVTVASVIIICLIAFVVLRLRKKKRISEIPEKEIELIELIGEGQFGQVYRGTWRRNTPVAVKILKTSSKNKEEIKKFEREARLCINLRPHPNIVQFLGVTLKTTNGRSRLITEYVKNGNLMNWMGTQEIPSDKAQKWRIEKSLVSGIVAGMDHLHANEILHRDLAARNILIQVILDQDPSLSASVSTALPLSRERSNSQGHVGVIAKISDFGLSSSVKGATSVPIRWAAPEIHQFGVKASSKSSDVWSFGILLFEIMDWCRTVPFSQLSNKEVIKYLSTPGNTLSPPDGAEPSLGEIMGACLNRSGPLRPSFSELGESLRLSGEVQKDPESPQSSPPASPRSQVSFVPLSEGTELSSHGLSDIQTQAPSLFCEKKGGSGSTLPLIHQVLVYEARE